MSQQSEINVASLVVNYAGARRGLWGASILRVGFSVVALTNYLWHIGIWAALWSPRAELGLDLYRRLAIWNFAPYAWNSAGWYSAALYLISIAAAILFGIGVLPRMTGWVFLVTCYASYARTDLASDAGQQLMILLLFLLCFMDTTAHLRFVSRRAANWSSEAHVIATMLHNSGRFLIVWQMCMVYFWAALWKLGGADWRHGTAMYYVLHMERFVVWPWFSNALSLSPLLVALMTYATLAIQLAFPFLIWNERLKPYITALMIGVHIGIAFTMGLVSFSAVMILADVSILTDEQLERFGRLLRASTRLLPRALHSLQDSGQA